MKEQTIKSIKTELESLDKALEAQNLNETLAALSLIAADARRLVFYLEQESKKQKAA